MCCAVRSHQPGTGPQGTEAMPQAGPWGLLTAPALCGCHHGEEAPAGLRCAQGCRGHRVPGVGGR